MARHFESGNSLQRGLKGSCVIYLLVKRCRNHLGLRISVPFETAGKPVKCLNHKDRNFCPRDRYYLSLAAPETEFRACPPLRDFSLPPSQGHTHSLSFSWPHPFPPSPPQHTHTPSLPSRLWEPARACLISTQGVLFAFKMPCPA